MINSLKIIKKCEKIVRSFTDFNLFIEEQVESESKRTIKRLEQQLNELKGEHYSLVRENKEQSEKLNKELQNSINAHLLKNIILKYLTTNEPSVRILKIVYDIFYMFRFNKI